ncbi:MAG TPA: phosphotransferase [Candidatus Polarisedimenticolaceae bacterium]|nr:phosphotransferase [Candidatus Polarisedimenticolaceae bacterium]
MTRARPELAADLSSAYPGARLEPLVGDASSRRFFRLRLPGGETRIVMDYGAPFTAPPDDVALANLLRGAGLPAPALLDVRGASGCLVLEDLGDLTLETALGRADEQERERLYVAAVDLARAIARDGTPALAASSRAQGPALDAARFRFEMDFFLEHFVGALRGITPDPALRTRLHALADAAAASSAPVLCHRDYHSRNLMVRGDGSLAMVDFQDARWGPDTYDLASLLRDAYVEIDEGRVQRMLARFGGGDDLRARFELVAAERMIKALGTFGYQASARGNPRYLEAVPRTLVRLRRTLFADLRLADLGTLLQGARLLDPL